MSDDLGFSYTVQRSGEVVIERNGLVVTKLRGTSASRFLRRVAKGDAQQVMARSTGNYKRGNERQR